MTYNGSGTFNRPWTWAGDAAAGTKILASRHDTHDAELAAGLSNAICRDGQSTILADIPWGGKKITNLASGVAPTDAVNLGQLDAKKTYGTGIVISGSTTNGQVTFTGATGPTGLSWTVPDVSFGVSGTAGAASWVWDDKANGTGIACMTLSEAGSGATALTLRSQLNAATSGPNLYLDRTRGTTNPAANDTLGVINFRGTDNTQALTTYGQIYEKIDDPTNGTEDGAMVFTTVVAGTVTPRLVLDASGADVTGNMTVSGQVISGQYFRGATTSTIFANTTSGSMYFRPVSHTNGTYQMTLANNGSLDVQGHVAAKTNVIANTGGINIGPGGTGTIMQMSPNWYWDWTTATGVLTWRAFGGHTFNLVGDGNFIISGSVGQKASGTTWSNPSDERIKNVVGDYETGLAEILQLQPRRFTYRGNYTTEAEGQSPYQKMAADGTEVAGFIAQEVEAVMPAMVTQGEGYIDGEHVTDFRSLDTSNLILALVNAVKELSAKVEALEAAR